MTQRAARKRKMTLVIATPKPRNPTVAGLKRKAGKHQKTRKAERRAAQAALKVGKTPDA